MGHAVLVPVALFFLLMAAATTLAFPWALRRLIDEGLATGASSDQLLLGFAELLAVALVLAIFSAARYYTVSWLGEHVTADVRQRVYAHVIEQSPAFFETTHAGEVLSRLGQDATLIHTVVGSSLSMGLRNLVMGIGALIMLVWTNPWMMLKVAAVLLAVVLPSVYLGRRVRRLSRASQDREADASAVAAEVLNAIPVVQSYVAEQREAERFTAMSVRSLGTSLSRIRARALLVLFIMGASSVVLLWGLYLGTLSVRDGTTTAGELGQTLVYVLLMGSALGVLGEVYGDVLRAAGATERLMELLQTRSEIQPPAHPQTLRWPDNGISVRIEHLVFAYPSRPDRAVLNQLSVEVTAGQTIALVGPSGAGKSSLFALLSRFYDPQAGRILLDGVPIESLDPRDLRRHISLVPQEPVIFSGSVLENIRYGAPDATPAQVEAAAQAAYADEFIHQLPQGYLTDLGDRGIRLSGGQRQRLAIARAILKNAPLLLLDEATSALDAHSERMVQAALQTAMKGRTTLVIAHRLATVMRADVIWVLDHGRLVEQGTHPSLIQQGGLYAKLAALQFDSMDSA
ncbi:MAG: ABC transporter transmembrane domain-containing protein [Limnohabitans sp.]